MATKRIFIAVNLPETARKDISEKLISMLPKKGLKIVKPENLHITLKFLGCIPEDSAGEIAGKLEKLKNTGKFAVSLKGLGHFNGKAIWLGIKNGRTELETLSKEVNALLETETERFSPHITLARNKLLSRDEFELAIDLLSKLKFEVRFIAESVEVMESELTPEGPIYSVVEKIALT